MHKEMLSNEVSHIHGHFFNLCVIELFYVLQHSLVLPGNEIDSNSLATKSATSANPEEMLK